MTIKTLGAVATLEQPVGLTRQRPAGGSAGGWKSPAASCPEKGSRFRAIFSSTPRAG